MTIVSEKGHYRMKAFLLCPLTAQDMLVSYYVGGRLRPFPPYPLFRTYPQSQGLHASYLKVDLVHHLVREHIALLARDRRLGSAAAAALLLLLSRSSGRLVLRLRVACQRGAVVSHVAAEGRREGRKEGGEGAKLDLALRDNGLGPYSMERRREKGPPCCAPAEQERAPRAPTKGPRAESRQRNPVRKNSTEKASRRQGSSISSANCPWEQDGGPGGSDATHPSVPS
ncbi:uncharacterized protein LOC111529333 [Piliocolobus tephrosceles]|uniref:uncharacterized protein LOC111529333 n=1 Tax=Piliocolobus tephrosceles TaxID=591936 RepID=UPI0013015911|nr:uncharacterized protein LOC111529333 [Piliocolobus tephrosceles]